MSLCLGRIFDKTKPIILIGKINKKTIKIKGNFNLNALKDNYSWFETPPLYHYNTLSAQPPQNHFYLKYTLTQIKYIERSHKAVHALPRGKE